MGHSSCTCSSARRRRSACVASARRRRTMRICPSRDGRRNGERISRRSSRRRPRTSTTSRTAGPSSRAPEAGAVFQGARRQAWPKAHQRRARVCRRDRRLPGHERHSFAGRGGRPGSRHRGGSQALVPMDVQASVLPRRLSPRVQLSQRQARGYPGTRCGRVTRHGIVVGDKEYEVDCVIFATGFEAGISYVRLTGFDIIGREGKRLSEHWRNGVRTLHGMTTDGFPNLFLMGGNQHTVAAVNAVHLLDEQASHVAHVIKQVRQRQSRRSSLQPKPLTPIPKSFGRHPPTRCS